VRVRVDSFSIVVADDHVLFRHGMKRLIEEAPGLAVIGEASDGQDTSVLRAFIRNCYRRRVFR
jgi:DNA-binding NarL/FixJ family response regulator